MAVYIQTNLIQLLNFKNILLCVQSRIPAGNKPFYILLFCLFSLNLRAQTNLVSNPSFEDVDSCFGGPSGLGFDVFQWSSCTDWRNPTYGSSDLWCPAGMSPPNVLGFYQYPRTGNNMSGIFIVELLAQTYREYIQNKLLTPLKANKYYEISFYANSADTFNYTSDIGIYFSDYAISQSGSYANFPYIPQIQNPITNFIADTLNWQKISVIYKAVGGEEYITIGCFNDSSKIILSNYDSITAGGVYLFIDDFSISEIPIELNIPNIYTPNNDGKNDAFIIDILNISNWSCDIFNRWGIKVAELTEKNNSWEGRTTSGIQCNDGVYYYVFVGEAEKQTIKEKGFIQLLR